MGDATLLRVAVPDLVRQDLVVARRLRELVLFVDRQDTWRHSVLIDSRIWAMWCVTTVERLDICSGTTPILQRKQGMHRVNLLEDVCSWYLLQMLGLHGML